MSKTLILLIGIAIALVTLNNAIYTVPEWQMAVTFKFGKIIGEPKDEAGLYFKIPFVHEVKYYDKRILSWDGEPSYIPTQGKYILIDTTARWQINNPRKFIETVQNISRADLRLTSILEGKTKNIISRYPLVETVRNTNAIIDKIKKIRIEAKKTDSADVTGEVERVTIGREKLSQMIVKAARLEINKLGIELIDVLIRRVAYEPTVEKKVFDRMISERNRIAEKIRSVGKGEKAKIEGKLSKDLKTIESEAFRTAEIIKGAALAEATTIYAESLKKAPDFYVFMRTLDAYKKTLPNKARFLISTDSEFFHMLKKR
jgi:membrane protease subunit HflC